MTNIGELQNISDIHPNRIRMLFLAKYAPKYPGPTPPLHPRDGIFPRYHHEIYTRLTELGFQLTSSTDFRNILCDRPNFDYVFSLYNRAPFKNSEVFVSAICEYHRIPYLGAPPHIRAVAEDKHLTKLVAKGLGIPTPPWAIYNLFDNEPAIPRFRGPYFVKPRYGAASEAVSERSVQDTWDGTLSSLRELLAEGKDVIVEAFAPGVNVTVPILGGKPPLVLPPVMTCTNLFGNIETYRQKRLLDRGSTRAIYGDRNRIKILQDYALRMFNEMKPLDYARFDFRVGNDQNSQTEMFLEFNVCCNLGTHSSVAKPAMAVGISHSELIARILNFSFRRQGVGR